MSKFTILAYGGYDENMHTLMFCTTSTTISEDINDFFSLAPCPNSDRIVLLVASTYFVGALIPDRYLPQLPSMFWL
jgi:hypothetical protein